MSAPQDPDSSPSNEDGENLAENAGDQAGGLPAQWTESGAVELGPGFFDDDYGELPDHLPPVKRTVKLAEPPNSRALEVEPRELPRNFDDDDSAPGTNSVPENAKFTFRNFLALKVASLGRRGLFKIEKRGDTTDANLRTLGRQRTLEEVEQKMKEVLEAQALEHAEHHTLNQAPWELDEEKSPPTGIPRRILIALWTAGIAMAVGSFALVASVGTVESKAKASKPEHTIVGPERAEVLEWQNFSTKAGETILGFCEAKTVEEKAKFVIPEENIAERMRAFYAKNPHVHTNIPTAKESTPLERGGVKTAFIADASSPDGDVYTVFPVREVEGGGVLIDWRAAICDNDPDLVFLLQAPDFRPSTHTLRVLITPGDYYNFEFEDSEKYLCLEISEPGSKISVHAYALRDSFAGKRLQRTVESMTKSDQKKVAGTLKMIKPIDFKRKRQFLIEELVSEDWQYGF